MSLWRTSLPILWNDGLKVSVYRNGKIENLSVHVISRYWNCFFFRWYKKGHLVTVKYRILVMCSFLRIFMNEPSENCATLSATFLST